MREFESIQGENLEEADMAQLLAVTASIDAVAKLRASLPTGPSLEECVECGEPIPKARQLAVQGCTTCIECQRLAERK
jgi:phage/conjugal plasmid C-4 type zinc finger TraR family protein